MNAFRVWSTIQNLLCDRGYIIPIELKLLDSFEKWQTHFDFIDDSSYPLLDQIYGDKESGKLLYVTWTDEEELNIKFLWNLFKKLKTNNIYHVIILYENKITQKAKDEISHPTFEKDPISKLQLRIEVMPREHYVINISKHVDQPVFELMSSEQKKDILRIHKTTVNKLPILRISDPISKYYGFVKGQVIKITRKDELVTYRVVS